MLNSAKLHGDEGRQLCTTNLNSKSTIGHKWNGNFRNGMIRFEPHGGGSDPRERDLRHAFGEGCNLTHAYSQKGKCAWISDIRDSTPFTSFLAVRRRRLPPSLLLQSAQTEAARTLPSVLGLPPFRQWRSLPARERGLFHSTVVVELRLSNPFAHSARGTT